jgi:cytochrome c553
MLRRWMHLGTLAGAALVCSSAFATTPDVEREAAQRKAFETHIRPLLAARCFKCHSEEKQSGNLRLDAKSTMLTGGDSGAAVVPGKPKESLIIDAINYESLEMPPSGKLPPEEIALLTEWVASGAYWPAGETVKATETVERITPADREYWAFQPPKAATPPKAEKWTRNEIDQFVLEKLTAAGLAPSREAEKIALLRRVSQDTTGLPPTPAELDAFLSDESPEAYEKVVDRLLRSPRFGEHQARQWLDLVRYAESDGYKQDDYRPTAWRYRDYVVKSFNDDKPYDRFVAEQLAGDEIDPNNPDALVATGFFRHGIYEYNQRDVRGQWRDMLNDITDCVGDVFLATSVGCARCHDHKFDPVLQKDYYRLQAFFSGLSLKDQELPQSAYDAESTQAMQEWMEATADVRKRIEAFKAERYPEVSAKALAIFDKEFRAIWNKPDSERRPEDEPIIALMRLQVEGAAEGFASKLKGQDKEDWNKLQDELNAFNRLKPKYQSQARMVSEHGPTAPVVFIPDKQKMGPVDPGFLSVIDAAPAAIPTPPEDATTSGRRTVLAKWLTQPDHPLTSRIIVNRIWQSHFGKGLVATPSDFGRLGEAPSHPKLLDWLAVKLVENGWSLKWLHRQILLSATYRQAAFDAGDGRKTAMTPAMVKAQEVDPQNRLLWHAPVRRLCGEQIRDSALAVAGELDVRAGGEGTEISAPRRAVFTKVIRNKRDPILDVFDFPERFGSVGERNTTTSPTQSLFMINGDWMLERAKKLADRIVSEAPGGEDSRVRLAYRLAVARDASVPELERAVNFIYERRGDAKVDLGKADAALIDFCHVLLNSNEFLYVD